MKFQFVIGLTAVLALGCGEDDRRGGGTGTTMTDTDAGGPGLGPDQLPGNTCEKMDILFVIDDSGSMAEEQGNLAANFPRFIEVLDAFQTGAGRGLDYRLGVTTTGKDFTTVVNISFLGMTLPPMTIAENGPAGRLLQSESCGMTRPWIERSDTGVADSFSCIAQVGVMGASTEMPLHMWELAVTDRVADGSNAGFLREDALLAVVILTDEDDCSRPEDRLEITIDDPLTMPMTAADECSPDNEELIQIDHFLSVFDTVKGDRGRWAVATIAGPGPGACTSVFGDAGEAVRLQRFNEEVGQNAVFSSICNGDLSSALMDALDTFNAACETFPPLI